MKLRSMSSKTNSDYLKYLNQLTPQK